MRHDRRYRIRSVSSGASFLAIQSAETVLSMFAPPAYCAYAPSNTALLSTKQVRLGRIGDSVGRAPSLLSGKVIMQTSSRRPDKDLGVILALLNRLNTFRMPRALQLKEQVDGGKPLSAHDLLFVKQALAESSEARRLAAKHPQYQDIVVKMTSLYADIVRKGAENEKVTKKPVNHHG
jgi:hypothetical protein